MMAPQKQAPLSLLSLKRISHCFEVRGFATLRNQGSWTDTTVVKGRHLMTAHLGDLSGAAEYRVRLEFTIPLEPIGLLDRMPYASLLTEIDANSFTPRAAEIRE